MLCLYRVSQYIAIIVTYLLQSADKPLKGMHKPLGAAHIKVKQLSKGYEVHVNNKLSLQFLQKELAHIGTHNIDPFSDVQFKRKCIKKKQPPF